MSAHSNIAKNARLELNEACQINRIKYPIFESSKIKGQWQSYCHFQGRNLSSMLAERKKDAEENLAGICLQVLSQSIQQGFVGSEEIEPVRRNLEPVPKNFELVPTYLEPVPKNLETKVLESDSSEDEKSFHRQRTPRCRPFSYNHILAQLEKIKSQMTKVAEEKIILANNPLDTDLVENIQTNCQAKKIVFIHTPKRPNLLTPVPDYDISVYFTYFTQEYTEQKEIEFMTTLTYEGRKALFVIPCQIGEEKYVTAIWMNVFLQLGARVVDVLADDYASDFIEVPITIHDH